MNRLRWVLLIMAVMGLSFFSPAWASVELGVLSPVTCVRGTGAPTVCTYSFPGATGTARTSYASAAPEADPVPRKRAKKAE